MISPLRFLALIVLATVYFPAGVAAQDVPDGYSFRTLIREYLARPKAVLDVHILRPAADVTSNIQIGKNEHEE